MFDAVLDRAPASESRLGTGSAVAIGFHALVFALAFVLSRSSVSGGIDRFPELRFRVAKGGPAAGASKVLSSGPRPRASGESKHVSTHRRDLVAPAARINPSQMPAPKEADRPLGESEPGTGVESGPSSSIGDCPGPNCPSGSAQGQGGGSALEVLPFGEGMTRPRLIQGSRIEYTREASEARVQGTMIVQCILTQEGRVTGCHALNTLPHMEEAVLRAVSTWRYTPVLFQEKPISVKYNIAVHLVAR